MYGKVVDLVGQTFGRLTVVKRVEDYVCNNGRKYTQWLCKCSCGDNSYISIVSTNLKNGSTKSCGCLQKEVVSKIKKKYNTYNLSGKYGIGYTSKDEEFYFDLEDYDLIKDYCWFLDNKGYVISRNILNNEEHIYLHKLLFPYSEEVDHLSHKPNDNRKENLRPVSHNENMFNKCIYNNNTSGVTGVTWHKRMNKWRVSITVNKKPIHLGYFDKEDFDKAVKIRKQAEEKYFGKYSYDNSIDFADRKEIDKNEVRKKE